MKNAFFIMVTILFFSGCAINQFDICNYSDIYNASLNKMKKKNSSVVSTMVKKANLPKNSKIIVTTITNIDRVDTATKSSTFGRVLAEDAATVLSNMGYKVIEPRLRKKLLLQKNEGEFVLSRDIKKIINRHRADAIFTGTYSVANKNVYVNYKLLEPKNGVVLSSSRYILPIDNDTRKLLGLELVEPKYCEE